MVKEVSTILGGKGGGGRPDFAQAGGSLIEKIPPEAKDAGNNSKTPLILNPWFSKRTPIYHPFLKTRAKNLGELYNEASFLLPNQPNKIEENCLELGTTDSLCLLRELTNRFNSVIWDREVLNKTIHTLAGEYQVKYKDVAQMVK